MPILDRPGARVGYEVAGEGPAVVLGHSLLCDGRMWEGVARRLAERRRVIVVDARGHRHSTAERRFALDDLADDWLAILDRERIERAALVGLSMGGMTAMRAALRAPARVAALALLDTSAEPEPPRARVQFRVMAEVLRAFGHVRAFEPEIARLMFGRTTRHERRDLVERELARIREQDPRGLYRAARAVVDRGNLLPRLGAIACPTLVLVGAEDRATPPLRSERIAAAIPGAALRVVPGAGHLTAIEAPEAVAGALIEHLGRAGW